MAEKPSFRAAYRHRRCIIPAGGFYEWQHLPDGSKQPWYIKGHEDRPLSLAGLWEHWKTPEGSEIETCTIITTAANTLMAAIHDRMPVILPSNSFDKWLDLDARLDDLAEVLRPCSPEILEAYTVSSVVNNPKFDSPACIARV